MKELFFQPRESIFRERTTVQANPKETGRKRRAATKGGMGAQRALRGVYSKPGNNATMRFQALHLLSGGENWIARIRLGVRALGIA